jgi:hypothetical protein
VAKAGKRRPSGRKLCKFDQKDRRDERERLDFTEYAPDPSLEDEYYGGFDSKDSDHDDGLTWRDGPFRGRKDRAPTWGRVWGRIDIDRGRFARQVAPKRWADDGLWGLVDGQTPETHEWLRERGRWPEWRKIKLQRAMSNQVSFPFALQKIALAEQRLPEVDPERDAAEVLDRGASRLEALADQGITDPNDRPFTPHNILHAERLQFYAQHTERSGTSLPWVQAEQKTRA